MLPQADTLQTIAEVGIAITGFAGIVAAVDRRSGTTAQGAHNSLGVLLVSSLGVVFFAFVPEWVASATIPPDIVWRISNGLFGTYRVVYIAIILYSARRSVNELQGAKTLPIGAGLGFLQLVAASGAMADFHYFLYLTGLLWGLQVALRSFFTLLRGDAPEQRTASDEDASPLNSGDLS